MKQSRESRGVLVRIGSRRRFVVPKCFPISDWYSVELTENGELILKPRIIVDPQKSLDQLDIKGFFSEGKCQAQGQQDPWRNMLLESMEWERLLSTMSPGEAAMEMAKFKLPS